MSEAGNALRFKELKIPKYLEFPASPDSGVSIFRQEMETSENKTFRLNLYK